MSSLRRDLVERKLWMVVAILVVAVVAVPVFLLKGASASTTPTVPAPPAGHADERTRRPRPRRPPTPEPVKVVLARIARDPFAERRAEAELQAGLDQIVGRVVIIDAHASASSAGSTTTAVVELDRAGLDGVAVPGRQWLVVLEPSSAGSGDAGSGTTTSTAPTSTIASTSPSTQEAQPAKVQSWTMYSVSVRFGKDLSVPLKTDVARLTPLPNVMAPQVMFMGVMSDGRSAVFALHAGVGHTGPGLCRPDHVRCSAIVLKAGQTEHLSVPTANGGHQDSGPARRQDLQLDHALAQGGTRCLPPRERRRDSASWTWPTRSPITL